MRFALRLAKSRRISLRVPNLAGAVLISRELILFGCLRRDAHECYARFMYQEKRGLRFPFSADGEIVLESTRERISARVTELSLRGCFLETSRSLKEHQHIRVKIWHLTEYFEALAKVLYLAPTGVGGIFSDLNPHSRSVLQAWILAALDTQVAVKNP